MPPQFRLVPVLPGEGTELRRFGWSQLTSDPSVGVLVEFAPSLDSRWVGNFRPGYFKGHTFGVVFVDDQRVVVVAAGRAYLVDPDRRQVDAQLTDGALEAYRATAPPLVIFNQLGIRFEAYDDGGMRWRTRRVSWDGARKVAISGSTLTAETWSAPQQRWIMVSVDLRSGKANGGAYDLPDATNHEVLARS